MVRKERVYNALKTLCYDINLEKLLDGLWDLMQLK